MVPIKNHKFIWLLVFGTVFIGWTLKNWFSSKVYFIGDINLFEYVNMVFFPLFLGIVSYFFFYHIYKLQHKLLEINEKRKKSRQTFQLFTEQLNDGNYQAKLDGLENSSDQLATSLIVLRDTLKNKEDNEIKRQSEDNERNWTTQGLAKFADLIRRESHNLVDWSYLIISKLVQYMDANQGGFYLLCNEENEEEDSYFELQSFYAYNRRKYKTQRIEWNEGVIGACAMERMTVYMTDIPGNYIEVTSGLGKATPSHLLVVPLIVNDSILGVIEIASFKAMYPYHINFVERLAEIIASNVSVIRTSLKTTQLLRESQEHHEMLSQHEEELRQNMEELQATQEDMERKQQEVDENMKMLKNIIDLVPFPIFVKNADYKYILANKAQGHLFNINAKELIDKTDEDLIEDFEELNAVRSTDRKVITQSETISMPAQEITTSKDGGKKVLKTIKVPFTNNLTGRTNILGVSVDVTEQQKVAELEHDMNEMKAKLEDEKSNNYELELSDKQ